MTEPNAPPADDYDTPWKDAVTRYMPIRRSENMQQDEAVQTEGSWRLPIEWGPIRYANKGVASSDNGNIFRDQHSKDYQRMLAQLVEGVTISRQRPLTRMEKQGLIKAFELTYELALNLIKDYIAFQGCALIADTHGAIREAFRCGLITDEEDWMTMINSRNSASHVYDEETTNSLVEIIANRYLGLFESFHSTHPRRKGYQHYKA